MVTPDELDVRLQPQVIHHAISPRPPVPQVSGDDQLINREIANQTAQQMDQVQRTTAANQFFDDGRDKIGTTISRRRMHHLQQQFAVFGRKNFRRQSQTEVRHQIAK